MAQLLKVMANSSAALGLNPRTQWKGTTNSQSCRLDCYAGPCFYTHTHTQ